MVTIQLIRLALTQQIMNQLQIGEYEQLVHQASESVGRGLIWERKALLPDDKDTEILRDERDFDAIVEVYKASFKHVGELINKLKHGLKVPPFELSKMVMMQSLLSSSEGFRSAFRLNSTNQVRG